VVHAAQLRAPGAIIEVLRDDAYRVELSNGHRCIAKAPKGSVHAISDQVTLEFHPYDLSRGRILPVV
jgi:translation initiation factor IF-1